MVRLLRVVGRAAAWPFVAVARLAAALWRAAGRLVRSFRAWVVALLIVLGLLIVYYALADREAPLTADAFVQAYVVQVAPQVPGRVVQVDVAEGQSVRAGDLLFALDPRPFEHRVQLLEARLALATARIAQLDHELAAATAERRRLEAESAYADLVNRQEEQIFRAQSTTERRYQEALRKSEAGRAAVAKAAGDEARVVAALAARVGDRHAAVAEAEAELAEARLELEYAKIYAPCDGIVTDLQLRDGDYARVGEAVLSVIDTRRWVVIAHFREECLANLRPGQPALVAFQADPGRLLPARVRWIGWGVGQGQGVPSGRLPMVESPPSWIPRSQRFQVRLELDRPDAIPLRVGMTGSVSAYPGPTDGRVARLTRALHRLLSWFYYL